MKVTKKEQWAPRVIEIQWPDELECLERILDCANILGALTTCESNFAYNLKRKLEEVSK